MPPMQERIDAQRVIVASLVPGSDEHKLATKILLLLQDSLHLMNEIDALTNDAKALRNKAQM